MPPMTTLPMKNRASIRVFYSYSHKDSELLAQLLTHMSLSIHQGEITDWYDERTTPGAEWEPEILSYLNGADIILLLISADFISSPYCMKKETERAMQRHHNREARVIPIFIRPVEIEGAPFNNLQGLPSADQPITRWQDRDEGWRMVAKGIRGIAKKMLKDKIEQSIHSNLEKSLAWNKPKIDPNKMPNPEEAMAANSPLYLSRKIEEDIREDIHLDRAMVTLRGSRQSGKTSLINAIYAATRNAGENLHVVMVDFQGLEPQHFNCVDSLWRAIINRIALDLEISSWNPSKWMSDYGYEHHLTHLLNDLFEINDYPILICLDEMDLALKRPTLSSFFSNIRSLYNKGANNDVYKKVRWLLGTSSEPAFFIKDPNQSPFNIGENQKHSLLPFSEDEIHLFAHRFGLQLDSEKYTAKHILAYLGGHPYLNHLLFHHMVRKPESIENFFHAVSAGSGIFRPHLERYQYQFEREPKLTSTMVKVIKGEGCPQLKMADRLLAAGLVKRDSQQKVVPLCSLYRDYFSKHFGLE
jgi:hypothetical protein